MSPPKISIPPERASAAGCSSFFSSSFLGSFFPFFLSALSSFSVSAAAGAAATIVCLFNTSRDSLDLAHAGSNEFMEILALDCGHQSLELFGIGLDADLLQQVRHLLLS